MGKHFYLVKKINCPVKPFTALMRKLPLLVIMTTLFKFFIGGFYSDIVYVIRNKEHLGETLYIARTF